MNAGHFFKHYNYNQALDSFERVITLLNLAKADKIPHPACGICSNICLLSPFNGLADEPLAFIWESVFELDPVLPIPNYGGLGRELWTTQKPLRVHLLQKLARELFSYCMIWIEANGCEACPWPDPYWEGLSCKYADEGQFKFAVWDLGAIAPEELASFLVSQMAPAAWENEANVKLFRAPGAWRVSLGRVLATQYSGLDPC